MLYMNVGKRVSPKNSNQDKHFFYLIFYICEILDVH